MNVSCGLYIRFWKLQPNWWKILQFPAVCLLSYGCCYMTAFWWKQYLLCTELCTSSTTNWLPHTVAQHTNWLIDYPSELQTNRPGPLLDLQHHWRVNPLVLLSKLVCFWANNNKIPYSKCMHVANKKTCSNCHGAIIRTNRSLPNSCSTHRHMSLTKIGLVERGTN